MAAHINGQTITSPYKSPIVSYDISYYAVRMSNSEVQYNFTVDTYISGYGWFGTGYILDCTLSVGGVSQNVCLKESEQSWNNTGERHRKKFSTNNISIICRSSVGGEAQTVGFSVIRPDGKGASGLVSTSDYYVISPALLWGAAGGATVNSIIDNQDNTLTVITTMGTDGENNGVSNVHIYGLVNKTDSTPSYPNNFDFFADGKGEYGTITGRTVTFRIPAPCTTGPYTVRICAYSISAQGDNPRGETVNSDTCYLYYNITYDANGGTGAPETQKFRYTMGESISTEIPTRKGYKFVNWLCRWDNETTFNPGDAIPTPYGNFALMAQWERNTFAFAKVDGIWKPAVLWTKVGDNWKQVISAYRKTDEGYKQI